MKITESRTRRGQLECFEIRSGDSPPEVGLLLCHGFGAPGTDLVAVGVEIAALLGDEVPLLICCPAALLDLAPMGMPGGRAWWPLDMVKLQRAIETGEMRDLRRESPPELPAARAALASAWQALQSETGLPAKRFVLGGFSQGGMLATDIALHADEVPGGLVIFSGTLLNEAQWSPRVKSLQGIPVMLSHGTVDQILPFSNALALRELLESAGADVRFVQFHGPHTIPMPAIDEASRVIREVAAQAGRQGAA